MKLKLSRLAALAGALALAFALCACGGNQDAAKTYSVDNAQTLLDSGAFDESMAQVNTDAILTIYGIDAATVEDGVCYMATNTSVSADELTILILTDESAAKTAVEACQARVESQIAVCESYAPAAVPRLEGVVIRQAGNTVLLAVGDPEQVSAAVDALG